MANDITVTPNVRQVRSERRCATRYYFGAMSEVIDPVSKNELVSLTRDLNLSGCFVETTPPFLKCAPVTVRITHSDASFTALGRVTDSVLYEGFGIAFVQIESNDQALLKLWWSHARAK